MKKTLPIALALILVPPLAHLYMAVEAKAVSAYQINRARATAFFLDKLHKPYNLQLMVKNEASGAGVDPKLAVALVEQESRWDPSAIRPEPKLRTASYGLFQILPETAKNCPGSPSAEQLLHPITNARCGLFLLSRYLEKTKSPRLALVAYNGGEACLRQRCPAAEAYAATVLSKLLL